MPNQRSTTSSFCTGHSYSANDEVSADSGANSFTFDSENHLMSMNGGAVTVVYDGDGNRVAKTVNSGNVTTTYLVDDLNPTGLPQVVDEIVGGVVDRVYTYGLQRISENQFVSPAWIPSYYEYDGEGSVRQLTSSAGSPTDTYEYDAFGNELNHTGITSNNYLYRGEQYDSDLSLYYLRARYYNPLTGRFLSVDSQANEGERRYEYAAADPVNGLDPTGNNDIIEFELLNFQPSPIMSWPKFCWVSGSNPMGAFLPGCGGGSGSSGGSGGGGGGGGQSGPGGPGGPPPPHPCSAIPGIPAYRASYLCRYYQPMVTKANAVGVDPALPLGLGIESHFADPNWPNNLYNKTGDAFGLTNGTSAHPVHASSPEDDVSKLFSEPTAKGCSPSYGERMRGTGTNVELFLQRLEREDANNNPLTGPPDKIGNRRNLGCMWNDHPLTWKPFIRDGISKMQHDIPIFLNSR